MKTKNAFVVAIFVGAIGMSPVLAHAFSRSDINQDTCIDLSDFYVLQSVYDMQDTNSDLNASGKVDLVDLSVLAHDWAQCPNTVNIRNLYPPVPNKNLTYDNYNIDGTPALKYEVMRYEPWADNKHFTVHHLYANVGDAVIFCPRIDDVFVFQEDKLFYTDTLDFYSKAEDPAAGLTRTTYTPGHLWGKGTMFMGVPSELQNMSGIIGDLSSTGCFSTSALQRPDVASHLTQHTVDSSTSWSPYTGGQQNIVPTLLLTELTKLNGADDDLFKEEWQFYNDPTYGYVPIEVTILSQKPGESQLQELNHQRLKSID